MEPKGRIFGANRRAPRVRSSVASVVVAYTLSRGVSLDELAKATGEDVLKVFDPKARVPEEMMHKIWGLLLRRFPGEPLSLQMAKGAPYSFFGGLAEGAQYADDLRGVLTLMADNRRIVSDSFECAIIEEGEETIFLHYHPLDHLDEGRTCEFAMGVAVRLLRDILATDVQPLRIEFAHRPNGPVAAYEDLFRTSVAFEQDQSGMIFRSRDLSAGVKHANLEMFKFAQEYFSRELERMGIGDIPPALSELRQAILENAARGTFDASAIAATAGMSLRTAQRLTSQYGVSISEMIDEVRCRSAKEFLAESKTDIESIAMTVGYSDGRAFRRAFKRWTGLTPSAYRLSLAGYS